MLDSFFGMFSYDVAIDLGTANTLVWIGGRPLFAGEKKGIVIREPSVVARHRKTKKFLAIGSEAKRMLGKTPAAVEALRPLRNGVIADFDATAAMLAYYIQKVHNRPGFLVQPTPKPRVIVGIPSGVTEVERRAVSEAVFEAGAREVFLIEEPMATAIGGGLTVDDSRGKMVIDIGGGTTEIAVISLSGIVANRSVRIAGDEMDEAIASFIRLKHSLLIGQLTAEEVKITIGSAPGSSSAEKKMVVRGRSLENGLPKSVLLSSNEIKEALSGTLNKIVGAISEVIEATPPELVGDIMEEGLLLGGGGALLNGIDTFITREVKMPVTIAEKPKETVVAGAAKLFGNSELLRRVQVAGGMR